MSGQGGHRRPEPRRPQPRRRAQRRPPRRARTLPATLGLTTVGTLVPGSALWLVGRRRAGGALLGLTLLLAAGAGYLASRRSTLLSAALDPDKLLVVAGISAAIVLALIVVSVLTYLAVRRRRAPRGHRVVEYAVVLALSLLVAAPFAVGTRFAVVQRDLVSTVFVEHPTVTIDEDNVWGDDDRVNVLLLGGDGGVHRLGIRTDTVMLASLDVRRGQTLLFSLPRNLQNVPFPKGSRLAKRYPDGFDGEGDPLEWMLNAVYRNVPRQHPHLLDGYENEGAHAVKQAVSGALGIPVDYYVLVNLRGFQQLVDAIGGVTVNINEPIPIGGNTDLGVPPEDYLDPGPSQHLDGFEALWFARGRYGLDDYNRMERQRCVVDAIIDEADPVTVLRRYEALADAGKRIVRTDIPQDIVPDFVELALGLQDGPVHSVVFRSSDRFDPNDPDFDWVQRKVDRTFERYSGPTGTRTPPPSVRGRNQPDSGAAAKDRTAKDKAPERGPCAYHPVG